ncbi:MAG: DUF2878 domain-containing protein [Luteimonas sp.]|nr:DUF2878 domain-containing protein [Luteimonas sp.]
MKLWTNVLGYQMVWFCAVIGAGLGLAWPGVAAATAFVAWQLAMSPQRLVEARLLVLALALGAIVDGMLAWRGWASYAAPWPSTSFSPIWILALWAAFSQTVTQSLGILQRNLMLALVFGAIGGPLAYLGASRGFGAVTLSTPDWPSLAWLAFGWGIAMVLLSQAARRWNTASQHEAVPVEVSR